MARCGAFDAELFKALIAEAPEHTFISHPGLLHPSQSRLSAGHLAAGAQRTNGVPK